MPYTLRLGRCTEVDLSWKSIANRERWGLSAVGFVDNLGISLVELLPHDVTAGRHGVRCTGFGWIAADRPVQLAGIDLYVRAPLFRRSIYLGLKLSPKIVGRWRLGRGPVPDDLAHFQDTFARFAVFVYDCVEGHGLCTSFLAGLIFDRSHNA